jgi:hypothetical protein
LKGRIVIGASVITRGCHYEWFKYELKINKTEQSQTNDVSLYENAKFLGMGRFVFVKEHHHNS